MKCAFSNDSKQCDQPDVQKRFHSSLEEVKDSSFAVYTNHHIAGKNRGRISEITFSQVRGNVGGAWRQCDSRRRSVLRCGEVLKLSRRENFLEM